MRDVPEEFALFSGTSHPRLGGAIAQRLGRALGRLLIEEFPDGEIGAQVLDNVRGRDVFVVQTLSRRPNHFLMELLILVDALKRASAKSVTAVIPYFAYARQDRKEKGRVPITAKLVADLLEKAGVDRVVTMDLHTEQIQGFFDIPVDNLYARPLFAPKLKGEIVVVSPDIGSNRMARKYAETLKAEIALVDKRRIGAKKVEARAVVGDVRGKKVVLVDDICSTGMTLCMAAEACREAGAREVEAVVTHAVCAGGAFTARGIDRMWISDTVPYSEGSIVGCPVEVVSAAPLFAEAMERIATNRSISSLFNQEERV